MPRKGAAPETSLVFDDLPLIDAHAHPPLAPDVARREPFARYFTEGHDPETVASHAPQSLFFRQALRDLGAFLGCAPEAGAVEAARAAQPADVYLRRLLAGAGVRHVLLDDGFPRRGALDVAAFAAAGGVPTARIVRIERLLEDLIPAHETLAALEGAFLAALEADAPASPAGATGGTETATGRPRVVALKSIIAYRGGLALARPDAGAAGTALDVVRAAWGNAPGRLEARPLLEYFFPLAAAWAARHGLPLQLHTGFGDRDLDLRLADPLLLRPQLEGGATGALAGGPVVLLHFGYPYVRQAAYLAAVYPQVSLDCSLAAPLLAGPGLTRALEEVLALAPTTKLHYGSDAWGVPEWFWLAAGAARRALAEALAWLPADEARRVARRILYANAAALYRLPRRADAVSHV
jgi:hypothetical protein